MRYLRRSAFCILGLWIALSGPSTEADEINYEQLIRRITDLERLATPPKASERSGTVSSYDRSARFDPAKQKYRDWGANRDRNGAIRREGRDFVVLELNQPGVIWRSWSARPGEGKIRIYIDGAKKPVSSMPFRTFFSAAATGIPTAELISNGAEGFLNQTPISFAKSCKIILEPKWGDYYRFDYSTFDKEIRLPSYTGQWSEVQLQAFKDVGAALSRQALLPKSEGNDANLRIQAKEVTAKPGEAAELCSLDGSGAIVSLKFFPAFPEESMDQLLRQVALSIHWDGESTPSVWSPVGDFFAVAPGGKPFHTLPVGRTEEFFYARWYMPFAKGARILVHNGSNTPQTLRFEIGYRKQNVDKASLRFHAKWHRDDFTGISSDLFKRGERWPDWPLLVTTGRGRFCGTHLHVWNPNPQSKVSRESKITLDGLPFRIQDTTRQATWRWLWSEGDDRFFVDGEAVPSHAGTGTDHYFGYVEAGNGPPAFDQPFHSRTTANDIGHVASCRFHIADAIPFQSRFEAFFEKYQPNQVLQYAATAFWYQEPGQYSSYRAVAAKERGDYYVQYKRQLPFPKDGFYEGEAYLEPGTNARSQNMRGYRGKWRGDHHLLWDGKPGDSTKMEFQVPRDSEYDLRLQLTKAPDYGVFEVRLNNRVLVERVDLYSPRVELSSIVSLGRHELMEGVYFLSFHLVGSNDKAKFFRKDRYLLGVDYLQLIDRKAAPENRAVVKVRDVREKSPVPVIAQAAPKPLSDQEVNELRNLLQGHCSSCHGSRKSEGELRFDQWLKRSDFVKHADVVKKMMRAVADKEMPPEDAPQPPLSTRKRLASLLKRLVGEAVQTSELPPIVMRRLNRYEYNNAVRDLLGLRGDIYPLPEKTIRAGKAYFDPASGRFPDTVQVGNRTLGKFQVERQILTGVVPFAIDLQAEHGFNNRGDELGLSPLLLETLVKLGQSVVNSPQFDRYCADYDTIFAAPPRKRSESAAKWKSRQVTEARRRITKLLERAFRRPPAAAVLGRYTHFFESEFQRTGDFAKSMKGTVAGIIASPHFIFLIERRHDGQDPRLLDDYELATRLAFFLWSSLPDAELLRVAGQGNLRKPEILDAQVRRMLKDKRCQALAANFARQWLRLDQLVTAVPDQGRFPTYYSRIGCEYWKFGLQSMIEPLLLFESIMVEDRSIYQLVDSDYAYRSDELQTWYVDKEPFAKRNENNRFNTFQQEFRRRSLSDRRQGGVITTAAVMTMTSEPLRTSPIVRGAWVATVIFNRPPDPPPDIVPEIEADDAEFESRGVTLRQRLKQHQTNQTCASCHSKIDPFGFALENYDVVGRWRDKYRSGLPIDTSGMLFGKTRFADVTEFKAAILAEPKLFATALTEHMLSYAIGRKLEVSDEPHVAKIVDSVVADGGRFSTLVRSIVLSRAFRNKTHQPMRRKPGNHNAQQKRIGEQAQ